MIALIRSISNVSTQFRKEFADVIWGRTRILLEDTETYNSLPIFQDFINQRPAICSGIRELKIYMFLAVIGFNNHEDEDRFIEFCQAISTLPNLEVLRITIGIYEDQGHFLDSGSRMHRCFNVIRDLPIKKKFELNLGVLDDEMADWEDVKEQNEYTEKTWARKIRKIMLPNTLRASKDTSTKGKYLRSRPKVDVTDRGVEGLGGKMAADEGATSSSEETEYETAEDSVEE